MAISKHKVNKKPQINIITQSKRVYKNKGDLVLIFISNN